MPEASKPAEQTARLEVGAEGDRAAHWMWHTGHPCHLTSSALAGTALLVMALAPIPSARNANRRFKHDCKPNRKGNSTGQRVARKAGGHRRAGRGQRKREAALPALQFPPALPAVCQGAVLRVLAVRAYVRLVRF